MSNNRTSRATRDNDQWLKQYYFIRAAFSVLWVAAALTLGQHSFALAAVLLIIYPAWDAAANVVDAARSGGFAVNRSQMINVTASSIMTIAVILALTMSMNWVLGAFGLWAIFSGLLQLGTAVRRWKTSGGQWAMILSGGQSALAGGLFIFQAQMPQEPSISTVAGYAGVGAFYFLVSAIWLSIALSRRGMHPVS
ncbi:MULTISPECIES: hypothetical protein [Rhizobium/Agrobacterium group]|jgi:uncharacterized membrane protein HdeD (DUF308 family)|uniref:hypothetical protein n=1 Tax=Rhizobium/Agrobacterium group TaxID=227290 RepID=UPI0008B1C031|nr:MULTISPECIES: hypothetical protein [Rhizobium/Agrobacterium group]MBY3038360.1 DUF308 domain-containing protein [Rhizobium laguerreae]MBY3257147.1 DUF308 domain-containing protein [Rhizobium laguerreae]MBY3284494.1 DUF308 domain-containing protein [Rhizobium laguerreae]MBY3290465.1 DUF308 domain-containing protein [Rhizobium laguerreae]MBY3422529.1 DUF308 domain-containing protein [Rhizobium laguerreae]